MSNITIRKYRNRKLYDQHQHRYITLAQILEMYRKEIRFRVLDFDDQDITEDIVIQSVITQYVQNTAMRQLLLNYAKENGQTTAQTAAQN